MADDNGWVPLREAAAKTGVSVGALRQWFRTGQIAAETRDTRYGPTRVVRLEEVAARLKQSAVRPVEPSTSETVRISVGVLVTAIDALAAALTANTAMVAQLGEAEVARRAAMRVVERLAGSAYAAEELAESERPNV